MINTERFEVLTDINLIKNGYIIITKDKHYYLVISKRVVELVNNNGHIWWTGLDTILSQKEVMYITNKKGELLVHDKITGENVK